MNITKLTTTFCHSSQFLIINLFFIYDILIVTKFVVNKPGSTVAAYFTQCVGNS